MEVEIKSWGCIRHDRYSSFWPDGGNSRWRYYNQPWVPATLGGIAHRGYPHLLSPSRHRGGGGALLHAPTRSRHSHHQQPASTIPRVATAALPRVWLGSCPPAGQTRPRIMSEAVSRDRIHAAAYCRASSSRGSVGMVVIGSPQLRISEKNQ